MLTAIQLKVIVAVTITAILGVIGYRESRPGISAPAPAPVVIIQQAPAPMDTMDTIDPYHHMTRPTKADKQAYDRMAPSDNSKLPW